jgi:ribosome maturation factor RimP
MRAVDRVGELVSPILDDLGLELYDLDQVGGVVRVLVDGPDGVGLDAITRTTRLLSRALDDDDSITGSYTLEVSSPGLERPLRTPAHFVRAIGSLVTVKTTSGHAGERRITGTLASADDDGIVVVDDGGVEHRVDHAEVAKARTVFVWGPTPKQPQKGQQKQAQQSRQKPSTSQKARAR